MECKIDLKLPYTDLSTMIRRQRQVIKFPRTRHSVILENKGMSR